MSDAFKEGINQEGLVFDNPQQAELIDAIKANTAIQNGLLEHLKSSPPVPMSPLVIASDKPMTKVEQALKMLQDNQDLVNMTTRDLEAQTGIDRNTWSKAKKRV